MPYLIGIEFFDQDVTQIETNDWRPDSNQPATSTTAGSFDATTYRGFKDLAASPVFNP